MEKAGRQARGDSDRSRTGVHPICCGASTDRGVLGEGIDEFVHSLVNSKGKGLSKINVRYLDADQHNPA